MSRCVLVSLAVFLASCGSGDRGGAEPADPGAGASATAPASIPAPTDSGASAGAERAPEEAASPEISGRAVVAADGGTAGEGEVSLRIGADGAVAGSISVGGERHSFVGVLDEGMLRCWIAGGEGDPERVRRGFLVGREKGGEYEGSFAISGNGGEPVIEGTWSAAAKGGAQGTIG